ncbi:MAG: hypothetical protein WA021_02640 [Minisyncoccia bacterium]
MAMVNNINLEALFGASASDEVRGALGVAGDTLEQQEKLLARLGAVVFNGILIAIVEALPEKARPEFKMLLEEGKAEETRSYLLKYIPDLDGCMRDAARKEVENVLKAADAES